MTLPTLIFHERPSPAASSTKVIDNIPRHLRADCDQIRRVLTTEPPVPKMPPYSIISAKNLITDEMIDIMSFERAHFALVFSICNQLGNVTDWLLDQATVNLHHRYPSGRNLLFYAVFAKKALLIKRLVAAQVDWQTPDTQGMSILKMVAAIKNDEITAIFNELQESVDTGKGSKGRRNKTKRGKKLNVSSILLHVVACFVWLRTTQNIREMQPISRPLLRLLKCKLNTYAWREKAF